MDRNSMHIPLQYKVGTKIIETKALLDLGAGGRFISTKLAQTLGRKWTWIPEKIKVFNVDGTANKTAWITHVVELEFNMAGREFWENFMISDIGDEEMILGLPWLRYHNPTINWETGEIQFPLQRRIQIKRFRGVLDNNEPEVLIGAKITASQEMAHQQQEVKRDIEIASRRERPKDSHPLRPMIMQSTSNQTSYRGIVNYTHLALQNKWSKTNSSRRIYGKDTFINPNYPWHPLSSSELNKGTVKNAYPLPLILKLLDKLKGAMVFTKLDLRNGYNNVRIKDGDQWKAAFKTNRGLFKPTVMFFGLSNSPATFQAFMNDILSDFIDEGWCVVYIDDILLFSKDQTEHREQTERLMCQLKKHDLFLKPEKYPVKLAGIAEWEPPQTVKGVLDKTPERLAAEESEVRMD
ncbi:reverse transcriptase-rnase h-integrase [Moniliophthora roreri MCA 2997]|uniref:Reverse transcriptase-rnase h-integrase n=1 Tax=Moniliophthora roreri (strain MCA 2997) TaxID=1381753 RepID=V2WKP7_MONRO|nr:reverse transcriptase-rnase h-integrase [Moniliophthora roreri MCA 2997]